MFRSAGMAVALRRLVADARPAGPLPQAQGRQAAQLSLAAVPHDLPTAIPAVSTQTTCKSQLEELRQACWPGSSKRLPADSSVAPVAQATGHG